MGVHAIRQQSKLSSNEYKTFARDIVNDGKQEILSATGCSYNKTSNKKWHRRGRITNRDNCDVGKTCHGG